MPLSLGHQMEPLTHKRHLDWKRLGIICGFAVLLVLLVAGTIFLGHQLQIQIDNQNRVTHTRLVLSELKETASLLKDAETGQRGFLYTGDVKYLGPYDFAVAQIERRVDNLARLNCAA